MGLILSGLAGALTGASNVLTNEQSKLDALSLEQRKEQAEIKKEQRIAEAAKQTRQEEFDFKTDPKNIEAATNATIQSNKLSDEYKYSQGENEAKYQGLIARAKKIDDPYEAELRKAQIDDYKAKSSATGYYEKQYSQSNPLETIKDKQSIIGKNIEVLSGQLIAVTEALQADPNNIKLINQQNEIKKQIADSNKSLLSLTSNINQSNVGSISEYEMIDRFIKSHPNSGISIDINANLTPGDQQKVADQFKKDSPNIWDSVVEYNKQQTTTNNSNEPSNNGAKQPKQGRFNKPNGQQNNVMDVYSEVRKLIEKYPNRFPKSVVNSKIASDDYTTNALTSLLKKLSPEELVEFRKLPANRQAAIALDMVGK